MKKKAAAILLCLVLTSLCMMTPAAGQAGRADAPYKPAQNIIKDETVYINLDGEGNVKETNVVNHIETPLDAQYTDYGRYEKIINLTNEVLPNTYEDEIRWNLKADEKGFYYQGALKNAEPPYRFKIMYSVDGAKTPALKMAGKKGFCKIMLNVSPNTYCADYFLKNYFCQIQAAVNMDECTQINAEGAVSVLSGRSKNISFTVMPNKTTDYEISFQTESFSFGGFTASCLPFEADSFIDIDPDEIKDGIDDLTDGSQKLADGTEDLKDGLKRLSSSLSKVSSGAKDAKKGLESYKTGVQSYTDSLAELKNQFDTVRSGMKALDKNAQELLDGFNGLKDGVKALFAQLAPLVTPEAAAQMDALNAQMDAYAEGLALFSAGLSKMSSGMDPFAEGLSQLDTAGLSLVAGLSSIIDGMGTLTDGLSKIASNVKKLPSRVGELLGGQLELKDGIEEAGDKFKGFETGGGTLQSFVCQNIQPRSVQFFYKTDEIKQEEEKEEQSETPQANTGLLEKFVDLFKPQQQ